jgi:hypothetical protein
MILVLVASQCDNPGSIGRSFGPTDPSFVADTVNIRGLNTRNIPSLTGNLGHVSSGIYNDPLFGRYETEAVIQPTLGARADSVGPNVKFYLDLRLTGITGDTTAFSRFEVYEITRRWRSSTWTMDSTAVVGAQVGTVLHQKGDTIRIDLNPSWTIRYLAALKDTASKRDSIYVATLPGLLIRGVDPNKLVFINTQVSSLTMDNQDSTLAVRRYGLRQFATSIDHTPAAVALPDSLTLVDNLFTSAGRLDLTISSTLLGSRFPNRVDLILFEDSTFTRNTLPPGHVRYRSRQIPIYLLTDTQIQFSIVAEPLLLVNRDPADGSYRANITLLSRSIIQANRQNGQFHILGDRYNGIISPALFFNERAPARKPKLLVSRFERN